MNSSSDLPIMNSFMVTKTYFVVNLVIYGKIIMKSGRFEIYVFLKPN